MKWILGLGDRQFPLADLTYVETEAETIGKAKAKATAAKGWAFVMTCVPADHPHHKRFPPPTDMETIA